MTKRFIIIALVLVLVCGALFVSCKPDPVKDNKAIGEWWVNIWEIEEQEYEDIQVTVKADKTFEGFVELDEKAVFSGTWEASSVNTGKLTISDAEETFTVTMNFYADDKNLIIYSEKGGEAVTLIKDVPNK